MISQVKRFFMQSVDEVCRGIPARPLSCVHCSYRSIALVSVWCEPHFPSFLFVALWGAIGTAVG